MTPPPLHSAKDADHLKILTIFHYVFAGFALLGLGFLALHYLFMNSLMSDPRMWQNAKGGGPPPYMFLEIMRWVYLFMGGVFVAVGVLNLLSAQFLRKRKHRVFSLVIAGLDCLQVPFGTALGVFTIVVLTRDSVRLEYEASKV